MPILPVKLIVFIIPYFHQSIFYPKGIVEVFLVFMFGYLKYANHFKSLPLKRDLQVEATPLFAELNSAEVANAKTRNSVKLINWLTIIVL